jgi:regulator of protease activity HflC (stomatin/prohibitin superfamily)
MDIPLLGIAVATVIVLIWFWNSLYIIKEWERGVVLRLGRLLPEAKCAGINLVLWPIETLYRISLRLETLDVPPQDIITHDNVSVKVNAVCYFRVVNANLALSQVSNYQYATSQLAQTTLRSVVGQFELDEILSQREKVNAKLQIILDQDTEPWGIKVSKVEVKQVDIPEQMQRAIAKQAEAERERRAKVIHADGEFEASAKLAEAAKVLETQPSAIQPRRCRDRWGAPRSENRRRRSSSASACRCGASAAAGDRGGRCRSGSADRGGRAGADAAPRSAGRDRRERSVRAESRRRSPH